MSRFVEIEEKRSLDLTWNIKMDINDTSIDLKLPAETRFGGDCVLSVKVTAPQTIQPVLRCWLGADSKPSLIYKPTWKRHQTFPSTTCDDFTCTVPPKRFADAHEANDKFNPSTHRLYRIRFAWDGMMAPVAAVKGIPSHLLIKSERSSALTLELSTAAFSSRYLYDVRLVFPHANNADLWASSNVLASASSYFKTLLESDFAENIHRGGSTPQLEGAETNDSQVAELKKKDVDAPRPGPAAGTLMKDARPTVDDSDDERMISSSPRRPKSILLDLPRPPLCLLTSHVKFAPLSSTFLPHNTTASQTRFSHLETLHTTNPSLPLPVFPKSIYRLAHVLEIPSLLAVSLDNIKSQLTVSNAARELFFDTSALYDEVRSVILDFVVANWAEIKESEGMKGMERKTVAGKMPGAGAVLFKLMALVSK